MSKRRLATALALFAAIVLVAQLGIATAGQNLPPTGFIEASQQPPSTFFHAIMNDPEGDPLTFDWTADFSCGRLDAGPPNHPPNGAEWEHGGDTDCMHPDGFTNHPGTIRVDVSDGVNPPVRCEYEGSASSDPNDPVECTEIPPEPLAHERTISISFNDGTGARNNGLVVFGSLDAPDGFGGCRSGQPVNIQRRVNGRWVTKKTTNTTRRGRYAVEIFDLASRYRAVAPRTEMEDLDADRADVCLRVVKERRHRHRR